MLKMRNEERAYQEINNIFNTDVVKLSANLKGMKFDSMNLDENKPNCRKLLYI